MEILDASEPQHVIIKLDFIQPMEGPAPYISKVLGLFFNMDRLIGNDFETGLANLKTVSEK